VTVDKSQLPQLFRYIAIGLLAFPLSANAVVDSLVQRALALEGQGQAPEAFELLDVQEVARAGDPDFDLALAIVANQTEHYTRAIFALERVLLMQPQNARAHAELGRAYFAVGDNAGAKRHLNLAKTHGAPIEAAKTIDQLLQSVERVEVDSQSAWRGFADIGFGYDSNAGSAPPASKGTGFAPLETAYSALTIGLSGRAVLAPRWSLIGTASVNARINEARAVAFDSNQMDISVGPSYHVDRSDFAVVGLAGTADVNGVLVRTTGGLMADWTYRMDAFRQFNTYYQSTRLTYPTGTYRNVDRNVVGASYGHQFKDGLTVFGGLYAADETSVSRVPSSGHEAYGGRIGVQKPLGAALAVFATLTYEDRDYKQTTRSEQQHGLTLGASRVVARVWRLTPQWSYTRNVSNNVYNDYEKQVLSVSIRREF
jgi:tetratricopeptide (TPR) repeat protein